MPPVAAGNRDATAPWSSVEKLIRKKKKKSFASALASSDHDGDPHAGGGPTVRDMPGCMLQLCAPVHAFSSDVFSGGPSLC
jgi:hypothetical protein